MEANHSSLFDDIILANKRENAQCSTRMLLSAVDLLEAASERLWAYVREGDGVPPERLREQLMQADRACAIVDGVRHFLAQEAQS